jgi:hypothetical protein
MSDLWATTASVLGGVAKFRLLRPDNVLVTAEGILLRGRSGGLVATLCRLGPRWSVHPGLYLTPALPGPPRFATARDRRRVRHALVQAWHGLWTPEAQEAALPAWFRAEWEQIEEQLAAARPGADCRRFYGRQNELLRQLARRGG